MPIGLSAVERLEVVRQAERPDEERLDRVRLITIIVDGVLATVGAAERLGLAAAVHEVATNHVQTIFQKPRLIFEGALA